MEATGRRPSRRGLLLSAGAVLATGAAGLAVEQGALPGRPWLQAHLGLDGAAGTVPDVAGGDVVSGSFPSVHRHGQRTGWSLVRPPGVSRTLPLVVALHGL